MTVKARGEKLDRGLTCKACGTQLSCPQCRDAGPRYDLHELTLEERRTLRGLLAKATGQPDKE